MSRVLSVLPVCLLIPALAIAQEVAKVTEKTRYAPPPMNQEGCGVEYECVAPNLCNDFGYVSDPESSKHPQVPAFEEGYLGGFSTIPDQSCVVPASGKQGRCCHKLPAEQCPNDDFCIPGWYCPPQDARRYEELHHHPRACLLHDAKYAVCCPKYRPYLRTTIRTNTRTCGVRNSDGIKPRFTIGTTPYQNENQLDERILDPDSGIYSNQSRFGEFPWQALIYSDSSQFLAGGVLITRKHVITAAHSVYQVDRISVRLGEWEVNSDKEFMSHEDYSVSAVNIHPDYKPGPEFNDIAVLLLKDEVVIRDHIHTVCLPVPQEKFDDKRCVATGWGKDAFEGKYSEILKKVLLPVVDRGLCEEALRRTRLGKHFHLHEHFLCAGGEFARDTCTGDGGGPLVCPVEGHYILAGIASWGIGCGQKNVPGVYVSVPSVMPWIDSIIAGSEWFSRVPSNACN